jgi:hypothetical protein
MVGESRAAPESDRLQPDLGCTNLWNVIEYIGETTVAFRWGVAKW